MKSMFLGVALGAAATLILNGSPSVGQVDPCSRSDTWEAPRLQAPIVGDPSPQKACMLIDGVLRCW